MNPHVSYPNAACYRWLVGAGILLLLLSLSSVCSARPLTATITDLKGQVRLYGRIGSPVIGSTVKVGEALKADDTIQTLDEAKATLTLSDGSVLQLGENTKIDIVALVLEPATEARKSQLKLLEGRMRATLSPAHQKKGSSFTVETPNALAQVEFSQPDVEVIYKPETRTTIIIGHTVAVTVMNLVTKEIKRMPMAHQAIVQDEFFWISPFIPGVEEIPPEEKQHQTRTGGLLQSRQIMGGIVSTVPISAGDRAETSQSPGPGGCPVGPRPRTVIINTSER